MLSGRRMAGASPLPRPVTCSIVPPSQHTTKLLSVQKWTQKRSLSMRVVLGCGEHFSSNPVVSTGMPGNATGNLVCRFKVPSAKLHPIRRPG